MTSAEKEVSLREKLKSSYPQLKAFYRGRKSIVESALVAFCKLITSDTSAKSSSLSHEFDFIIESEGRVKLASMYQERKSTKLGTTAAYLVKSIDLYNRLLEQTSKRNLVKECQLYLNCEFMLCAFKCLAYFTCKIGMPYLNMCELSSQKDIKQLLPRFYHELKDQNLSFLDDFHVEWNRISMEEPRPELAKHMLQKMCDA